MSQPLTLEELSFLLWATQGIDEQATQAFGHGQEEFAIYVAPVGKVTSAEYHFDH